MWLLLLKILLLILIKLLRDRINYFKYRNVPYLSSIPPFGVLDGTVFRGKSIFECYMDAYNNPKFRNEPFLGLFQFLKPVIVIKDIELLKRLAIKDFTSFNARSMEFGKHDPFYGNMGKFVLFFKIKILVH
jgi:cytochrome P450 family 9